MKNSIYIFLITFLGATGLSAQQTSVVPHNYNNQFLSNPGATGIWDDMEVSGFYTKAFSNVDNAPTTMFAALQYPVPGQNAAFGLSLQSDKASLLSSTSVSATGAYKIRGIGGENGFISLGFGGSINHIGFSGVEAVVADLDEPNLGGIESGIGFNFQAGLMYATSDSYTGRNSDDMIFQFGLGMGQVQRKVNIKSLYTYQDEMQLNGYLGFIFSEESSMVLKSYVESYYEMSGQMNVTLGARAIMSEAFVGGFTFDNNLKLGIELGYVMKSANSNPTTLVINFNVPFSQVNDYVNPGVGLSFHHQMDLDSGW